MSIFARIFSLRSQTLARSSFIVFIGTTVTNIAAYIYHLAMGRILGPVGYGELSSMISLLYILGVAAIVLQTTLVQYFTLTKSKEGQSLDLYLRAMKYIVFCLLIGVALAIGFAQPIAAYLNLTNARLIVWTFLVFMVAILPVVHLSVLQAFQFFVWFTSISALTAIVKLILSVPLAYYGVEMALIAAVISGLVVYGISFIPVRFIFKLPRVRFAYTKKETVKFMAPTFITLLGFTSLYSFDILLVKHYLNSFDAGIYAAVSILGKIVFYASSAVASVLYPILIERFNEKKAIAPIMKQATVIVLSASFLLTLVYFFFPRSILHLLFGSSYDGAEIYLGLIAVYYGILSVCNIFIMSALALKRMAVWTVALLGAVALFVGISLFHESISNIIWVNIFVASVVLVGVFTISLRDAFFDKPL